MNQNSTKLYEIFNKEKGINNNQIKKSLLVGAPPHQNEDERGELEQIWKE